MKTKKVISTAVAAASAAIAAGTAANLKKKNICPICEAKKLLNKLTLNQKATVGYNNGTAMTPPMGWSSWNLFATKINEDLIKEIADAMHDSGLQEAGYQYINIDDCWQASERDSSGQLQSDRATFPNGIPALVGYVNSKGLKLGIYSSNGSHTCEDYPASLGHEAIDADTFARWGVEYFKYDFCHNVPISPQAPKISLVEVSKLGEASFLKLKPSELRLTGKAKIIPDESKKSDSGESLIGLCSRTGTASFDVEAVSEGEYALTFTVMKEKGDDRFLRIMVNGSDEYHLYSVASRAADGYRRIQQVVLLREGVNTIEITNPVGSRMDSAAIQYKLMGRELKRATKQFAEQTGTEEKPITFSICEWGWNRPWKWGLEAGNLWRTTPDIKANWASIMSIYEITVRLYKYSAPGGWNDPDMLEVGNGNLTFDENKSHFSLWCMMCAPLILGNDIRKFIKEDGTVDSDSKIYQILTNKAMISIDQDKLGIQCRRIKTGIIDVLVKPLENSKIAVCVLNKGIKPAVTDLDFRKLSKLGFVNLPEKESYNVYDVWNDTHTENVSAIGAKTDSHGVCVYIVE